MNEPRSARYQRLRRRTRVAGLSSGLVVLALLALTPAAPALYGWCLAIGDGLEPGPRAALAFTLFVALVTVAWPLAALPAMLYSASRVAAQYGPERAEASAGDVVASQFTSALVLLPVVVAAAGLTRLAIMLAGSWWWLAAGLMLAVGLVLGIRQLPALVARFGRATPLGREALASRLAALAARAGVQVQDLLVLSAGRDAATTALVSGVGASRSIFLSADVARDWSDDEVAVVVAHELGHCVHQDAWRTLTVDAALVCAALGLAHVVIGAAGAIVGLPPVTDVAALPAIAFVAGLGWILATPLRHAQSRRHERRADAFALALTGSADAFDAAIRRLGEAHLAEEHPGAVARWLFHRHPSVGERLEYARTYRELTQVGRDPRKGPASAGPIETGADLEDSVRANEGRSLGLARRRA